MDGCFSDDLLGCDGNGNGRFREGKAERRAFFGGEDMVCM